VVGTTQHEVPVARYPQAATLFFYVFINGFVGYTELAEFAIISWDMWIYVLIFQQRPLSVAGGGDQGVEYANESRDTGKGNDQ